MRAKSIYTLFQALLFFLFLDSLNAWFTWNLGNYVMLSYLFISGLFFMAYRKQFLFRKYRLSILLYLLATISLGITLDFGGIMGFVCKTAPVCLFIATKSEFKTSTFILITRYWLYILIPSLLVFGLTFLMPLPNLGAIHNESAEAYRYTNYIFVIKGAFYNIRFNSIFLEPGHLGMIIAFFLYALRFDFSRWEVWSLMVVEFFTLSLAGYVLVGIGYVFSLIVSRKGVMKLVIFAGFSFGIVYAVASSYNNGNNLVNKLIFERLAYDEEKGVAGNNRFGKYAEDLVENKMLSGNIWLGSSKQLYKGEFLGAGWKVFFIKYGMLPMLTFLIFYFSFLYTSKDKRYVNLFIVLLATAFLQRSYPYWFAWNFPFIAGIAMNELHFQLGSKTVKAYLKNGKSSVAQRIQV